LYFRLKASNDSFFQSNKFGDTVRRTTGRLSIVTEKEPGMSDPLWHLSENSEELTCTELEFALMRCYEAFGRWQSECLASVSDTVVTGPENALLHLVRMNNRAKSIKELARLTNRDDIPNIQYSMRKLVSEGLVEKHGSGRTGVTYNATVKGVEVTEEYSDLRKRLLIEQLESQPQLGEQLKAAGKALNTLSGIYEEASRVAALYRR